MPACHAGGRGFEPRHSRHSLQDSAWLQRGQWVLAAIWACRGCPCCSDPDRTMTIAIADRNSSEGSHPTCPLSPIHLPARRRIRHSAAMQGRPGRTQPAKRCWEPCSPGNMAAAAAMFPGEQGSQHRLAGCVRPGRPCMAAECRMRLLAGKCIGDNGHVGWDPSDELRSAIAIVIVRSGSEQQGQPRQAQIAARTHCPRCNHAES